MKNKEKNRNKRCRSPPRELREAVPVTPATGTGGPLAHQSGAPLVAFQWVGKAHLCHLSQVILVLLLEHISERMTPQMVLDSRG